jgi:heptosyltransferase-2
MARIPRRIGYAREARGMLLTDARRLDTKALPRLVDQFVALAAQPGELVPISAAPVLVPDAGNAAEAIRALGLSTHRPVAILCPGAEFGPAKRWPAEHFITLAQRFIDSGYVVWLVGSPNDRVAADPIAAAIPEVRDVCGRTDLGTAIDLLATASVVVSNDSGLMHAAAAVGRPLVALFGSSSPNYTPPLSPIARVAKIEIVCSPCFQRECPLGHFKCMRELSPNVVYDLARTQH